jgi:hypothetical protein
VIDGEVKLPSVFSRILGLLSTDAGQIFDSRLGIKFIKFALLDGGELRWMSGVRDSVLALGFRTNTRRAAEGTEHAR